MKRNGNTFSYILIGAFLMLALMAMPAQAGWGSPVSNAAAPGLISYNAPTRTLSWEELQNQAQAAQTTPEAPPAGAAQEPSTAGLIDQAAESGEIDSETAALYMAYALTNDPALPAEYRSDTPWDGTLPLLWLRETVNTLPPGRTQEDIAAMLAGVCDTESTALANTHTTTHFYIEYGSISGGLTINSYAVSLETTWDKEVTSFGWAAPPSYTSNPAPGNRYHVRIDDLGTSLYGFVSSSGTYAGYVGNNPNTSWSDGDAYASCMVLNRNYDPFPGTSQAALDATTAHEFNHSIQMGYGALTGSNVPDDNLIEGGASWMEDEAFDSSNDNYNYLWPSFSMCMGNYTASPYNYWITYRGLTERYGAGTAGGAEQVMQDFWEYTSKNTYSNLAALNAALVNRGTTLADSFHHYAIAVKFNKTCSGGYVYPYCLEEGAGYISAAGSPANTASIASVGSSYNSGLIQDNYAINWIGLPTSGGLYDVTLQNTSSGGQLRGSVVCNTGSALSVMPLSAVAAAGQSVTLLGVNPTGCTSVVLVVTNQSQTSANPTSCTARSYKVTTKVTTATATPTLTPTVVYFNFLPYSR